MTFFNVNCPLMLAQVNWFQWAVACPHCPFSTVFPYRFITTEKTEFNDLNPMNGESNESSESDEWWIQCIQWIQWIANPVNCESSESDEWWVRWDFSVQVSKLLPMMVSVKHEIQVEVNRPVPGWKFRRKGRLPVQGLRTRLQERIA